MLDLFDLRGVEKLEFWCVSKSEDFRMAFIPSGLTSMTLEHLEFNSNTLSGRGSQLMPHLIELSLVNSNIEGNLQRYLDCPKLKKLSLDQTAFVFPKNSTKDNTSSGKMPLSSSILFPSIPKLECLDVCNVILDNNLIASLQSCPLLQYLSAEWCSIEDFIPSFTTAIADGKVFPSLKILCIDNSWKVESQSRRKFAQYCVSQRLGLAVSANNSAPPPRDSSLDTDP
jgi:hypothetical protein